MVKNTKDSGRESVTISLYVDNDFIDRVNKAKGNSTRSGFIIGLVEDHLEQHGFGKEST